MTAVQLYTVRDAIAVDLERTLARIAALGYDEVELYDFVTQVDRSARALPAAGLRAVSGHAHLVGVDAAPALDAARRLGMRFVIEPAVPRERWASARDIAATADALNAASAAAGDLRIGYHNHAWELTPVEGRSGLELLAEHLVPDLVLELDLYWAAAGGADVPALLATLGDRVALLHVKDGVGTTDTNDQVPPGSGTLGIGRLMAAAPPHAVRIVEFDGYRGDIFDALAASIGALS